MKPLIRELQPQYSIIDYIGDYEGIWFCTRPSLKIEPSKYYLGVKNIRTNKIRIKGVKRFYFSKDAPYFKLVSIKFNEKGLLAEVDEFKDKILQKRPVIKIKDMVLIRKNILIPKRKFPK